LVWILLFCVDMFYRVKIAMVKIRTKLIPHQ